MAQVEIHRVFADVQFLGRQQNGVLKMKDSLLIQTVDDLFVSVGRSDSLIQKHLVFCLTDSVLDKGSAVRRKVFLLKRSRKFRGRRRCAAEIFQEIRYRRIQIEVDTEETDNAPLFPSDGDGRGF